MDVKNSRSIEIPASVEYFEKIHSFIEKRLCRSNISKEIMSETFVVLEALFSSLLDQGFDQDTLLRVSVTKSFGEINIDLGFEGKPFAPVGGGGGDTSPEASILKAFEDKFSHSYWNGYNRIHIAVKRSFQTSLFLELGTILIAVLVYIPINACVSIKYQLIIADNIVFPLIKMFSNGMLMIGAPVTFFLY